MDWLPSKHVATWLTAACPVPPPPHASCGILMRTKTRRQLINAISQPQPEAAPCHTPLYALSVPAAPAENEEPFKMPGILQVCRKREAPAPPCLPSHLLQLLLRHCLHATCHMCPTTPPLPACPSISMPPQLLFILVGVGGGVGVGANGLPYIKMHSAAAQTINMNLRVRHDQQQQQPPGPAVARCTLPAACASISRLWPD